VQEAWRSLDRTRKQAHAKEITSIAERDTRTSIARQEEEKLEEIEKQIHECKIMAPQSGLVVYYVSEQSRSGSGSSQSIIAQGEPVREGQKLMRIPDLTRMQVSTRVHEATISRIRGDDRRSTGFFEALRLGMLLNPDSLTRLVQTQDEIVDSIRGQYREKEYYLAGRGQNATIRLDAFPDRRLKGHVRMIASVASQQDWMSADVKLYQTIVSIDEPMEGLKPGMSAEVVIEVDATRQSILAVPIQAIVGGTESGPNRKIYAMTPTGPEEREIVVGFANEKMAEIVSGLEEGDRVVENPKLILGDKARTREVGELRSGEGRSKDGKGKDGKGKDGKGKKPDGI